MYCKFIILFCLFLQLILTVQILPLSDKRYCGFQHVDDYVRPRNETSIDEFPWVAALIYKFITDGTRAFLCGGSLINTRYILTAAQCLTHPKLTVLVGVRLGEYSVKNTTDCVLTADYQLKDCTNFTDYGIEEKIVHDQYDQRTRVNDIALLRLNRVVEYTDYIRPICLFSLGPMYAQIGDTLHVSGWGRKFDKAEPAEIKKKISTILITNKECGTEFPKRKIFESQICTKDSEINSEFTCQGDAGAPVMFVYGSVPQWHIEGVTSWGGRCGFADLRVHTRVSDYLKWIQGSIRP